MTIRLKDGRSYADRVDFPRGSGPRGIDWADIDAKYRTLVPMSGLPADRMDASLEKIHAFKRLGRVSEGTKWLV